MKAFKFLRAAIILLGILSSACTPSANSSSSPNVGGGKPLSEVVFSGVIESINGDQWVINGKTVKVDPSVFRDGPFMVGDTVKVEAIVENDGSVIAQRVESPSAADLVEISTGTPAPAATEPQSLVFDDSGTEATGIVDAMTDTSITVGGQTFTIAQGAQITGEILPGVSVKLHFTVNSDGTLTVSEIEIADPTQISNDNTNDDNSNNNANDDNSNDDNGNDNNSNDDHGNDNSNDDNSNDDNSNDDQGGGSNDDNGGNENDSNNNG